MGRGTSMTVQGLCVLLCLLSSADSVSSSVLFHTPGDTARIKCLCSRAQGCYNELIRWVRINSNGSLQIIDAKCDKPPCNFTSTEVNNTHVELKITHVKPEDSGRYYCGEHLASYLQFNGIGVALQVGDVNLSATKVHILKESKDGKPYTDKPNISFDISEGMAPDRPYEMEDSVDVELGSRDSSDVKYTELRCVVTRLSTPWVNVIWKSSTGEKVETNKTWSLTDSSKGVESRLRIGVMAQEAEDYYDFEDGMTKLYKTLDKTVEMQDEWWCEVQVGRDIYSGVTYAQLDIRGQPKTDRQQRHKDRQADKMVYSEVRNKVNSQSDVYSGVTYAKLDIKGQPRTDRRQRQKDRQADRMVYSEVRSKPNNGQP
ncbi:hypothetical protein JZ751_008302 [Albula glossodonta]|uniref:Ig-like domain-containing protein n=1 Tax=Albula glossodonta TaxID=121402 RepID=A0A8T2N4I6_9TELE|nr:hypothetical protein JZ751_008302 [Albula glossodonta]